MSDALPLDEQLLPYVNAIVLSRAVDAPEPQSVLSLVREVTTPPRPPADVLDDARARAESLPAANDARLDAAMALLKRLQPMPALEREWVVARLVERLPATEIAERFGLASTAIADALLRGARLLLGTELSASAYLNELSGSAPRELVQLENELTVLTADVTALSDAPLQVARPRDERTELKPLTTPSTVDVPEQSRIATFAAHDLPAAMGTGERLAPQPVDDRTESAGRPLKPEQQEHTMVPVNVPAPLQQPPTHPQPKLEPDTTAVGPSPVRFGGPVPLPMALRDDTHTAQHVPRPLSKPRESTVEDPDVTAPRAAPLPPESKRVRRPWLVLAAAVVLGGISWGAAAFALRSVEQRNLTQWQLQPVIVSNRDLAEGDTIPPEAVAVRRVPASIITSSVVSPDSVQFLKDQRLRAPVQAGDPLLWSHFESVKEHRRLSRAVERRMRAYSVAVSQLKATGGWAGVSERADFVLSVQPPMSRAAPTSEKQAVTLLQDVFILSVGKASVVSTSRRSHTFHDVSALLLPEEAEMLALAVNSGELTLALRHPEDHSSLDGNAKTTIKTLLDGVRVKKLEARRAEIIEHIRSGPTQ